MAISTLFLRTKKPFTRKRLDLKYLKNATISTLPAAKLHPSPQLTPGVPVTREALDLKPFNMFFRVLVRLPQEHQFTENPQKEEKNDFLKNVNFS